MRNFLFILFPFFALFCNAQTSVVNININVYETDTCFTVFLFNGNDTVYKEDFRASTNIKIDSLKAGAYKINIYTKAQDEPYYTRYISLLPTQMTDVYIQLDWTSNFKDLDLKTGQTLESEGHHEGFEAQLGVGYFDDSWINKNSRLRNNYSAAGSLYRYAGFTKHIGFLGGVGATICQNYFSRDSILTSIPVIYERYNDVKINLEVKLRFSTGNQRKETHYPAKLFLDIGAGYYFPVSFRHTTYYKGNIKVTDKYIHQYTDFRVFANLGYSFFAVFCEYRLTDFLMGNYQEVPKYNAGIRVLFGAH